MLAVQPQSITQPRLEAQTIEQEPSLSEVDVHQPKQIIKRKIFTPLNIMIVLAFVAAIGAGSYYLLNLNSEKEITNQINLNQDKIITYADSSKKEGSNSGSSSSKSSNNNNKPTPRSHPASRGTISSNPGLIGNGAPDGDDQEDKDSDQSKKKMSTTDANSFEQDSDQQEDEQQDDLNEPTYWVDANQKGVSVGGQNGNPPMVGNGRDGN